MTTRFGRGEARRNGKLALVVSTTRDPAGDRLEERVPLGDRQVGPDEIELGVGAVAAAVADNIDEQQIVRR